METSIEPELQSLLKKLTAELENDNREIEIRQKRIKKNEALLHAVRGSLDVTGSASGMGYGSKAEMVRNAVMQVNKQRFTQGDVEAEIKRANPSLELDRNRIRSVLWSLAHKHGFIKQVGKGNNRQLAAFEKVAAQTNGAHAANEPQLFKRETPVPSGAITLSEVEAYVRQKSRRVNKVAAHFNVNEEVIKKLLEEPTSKAYEASRGWVKIRE